MDLGQNVWVLPAANIRRREARDVPITTRLKAVLEMRRLEPAGKEHPPDAYVFANDVGKRSGPFDRRGGTPADPRGSRACGFTIYVASSRVGCWSHVHPRTRFAIGSVTATSRRRAATWPQRGSLSRRRGSGLNSTARYRRRARPRTKSALPRRPRVRTEPTHPAIATIKDGGSPRPWSVARTTPDFRCFVFGLTGHRRVKDGKKFRRPRLPPVFLPNC